MIRVDSPPTAPYTLRCVLPIASGRVARGDRLGVRPLAREVNDGWFQTQTELIARTKSHDYFEVCVNVTSGTHTQFAVDVVDGDVNITSVSYDSGGYQIMRDNGFAIDPQAWRVVNAGSAPFNDPALSFDLRAVVAGGGQTQLSDRAYLTGFGPISGSFAASPQRKKMWTSANEPVGHHRWGNVVRTLYKHIPMKPGGNSGYLHVWATVFANSPEIQFIVNWHNGVVEERRSVPGTPGTGDIEDPSSLEEGTATGGFGAARMRDVLFSTLELSGFQSLSSVIPVQSPSFTGATYSEANKSLTSVGAFADYVHAGGNRVQITSGTGATIGDYEIARKVSNDEIRLVTSIGASADTETDIAGYVKGYWTMTPELIDSSVSPALPADSVFEVRPANAGVPSNSHAIVGPCSPTDPNRLHPLLITNERCFRFAIHPSSITPYRKLVVGRADWSRGGWGFSPLGAPDFDAVNSSAVGMDLTDQNATAKTRLRTLQPYRCDNDNDGMLVPGKFCPNSWNEYGGETSGVGMWHDYGLKATWDAKVGVIELLKLEQLRVQTRHYGCLYYNLTGMPVNTFAHTAGGTNAPWSRADRRFLGNPSAPKDVPFLLQPIRNLVARANTILDADYNPGPRGKVRVGGSDLQFTPQDQFGNVPSTTISEASVPDWWVWGEDENSDGVGDGVHGDLFVADYYLPMRNTAAPTSILVYPDGSTVPIVDEAASVVCEIRGAGAFNNTKSVTFEITGTGELDLPAVETFTVTGPASGAGSTQSFRTVGDFKTVTSIRVVSVTGTLLSTERFRFGRSAAGIPDYFGDSGGILAIDSQHQIRQTSQNKALFLVDNDPLAKLYLWMNAMDQRMQYWELGGQAHRFDASERGAPGRGVSSTREHAWAMDTMCAWLAIANAHYDVTEDSTFKIDLMFGPGAFSFGMRTWLETAANRFTSGLMSNGAFASYDNKNSEQSPTGIANGSSANGEAFYIMAGRETSYFAPCLLNLSNIWVPTTDSRFASLRTRLEEVKAMLLAQQSAFKNYFSQRILGATGQYHTYLPVAARKTGFNISGASWNPATFQLTKAGAFAGYSFVAGDTATILSGTGLTKGPYLVNDKLNNDTIRLTTSPGAATSDVSANVGMYMPVNNITATTGVWEVYGPTQEDMPEYNPITGLAINPITYPQYPQPVGLANATWTEGTKYLTKTGAFTNYTWASGDKCDITSGTGATPGTYNVVGKVDNNTIELQTSIGAGADGQTNIAGNVRPAAQFRFAAAVAGNSAQMNSGSVGTGTAFTIANADCGTNFATGVKSGTPIPVPVRLMILGGSTFTSSKRRTFRIQGTGFVTGAPGLTTGNIQEDLFVQGNGNSVQAFQTKKHFVTVTSIQMIPDNGSGTTVSGESFSFGTGNVGLKANPNERIGGKTVQGTESLLIGEGEGFHMALPLAVQKYLAETTGASSTDVDTMIQRWTSTASLASALSAIQGFVEYGGSNPSERIEHCSKLLWQLGMNTGSISPVADFGKTASSGAAPLTVGVWAKPIGRIATYEWDFAYNGVTPNYTDTGKYATHTYATPATYTILLRVTDTDGSTATSSQTVVVS